VNIERMSGRRLLTGIQNAGIAAAIVLGAIAGMAHSSYAAPATRIATASAVVPADLVYLYEDGEPVLQPTDYVIEGAVYTDIMTFVGNVDPSTENILDSNDDVIGYVESGGPD